MMAWLALWLACAGSPGPLPDLPTPFDTLGLPAHGTTLDEASASKIELHTESTDPNAVLGHWMGGLAETGWAVYDPEVGPGFVRVMAERPPHELKVFVVQKRRGAPVQVHLVLTDL
jgi:hypothetical protein